nr:Brefeldin A-inhibited guanine nucleotide-exchange protein 1 [Polyrhizophydium stewartii]
MLVQSLERLLAEAARLKDVREAIDEALEALAVQRQTLAAAGEDPDKIAADRYWLPFKLALQPSRPVKVREAALHQLQKLIAHNLLRGSLPGTLPADDDPAAAPSAAHAALFGRRFSISALFRSDLDHQPPQPHALSPQPQPAAASAASVGSAATPPEPSAGADAAAPDAAADDAADAAAAYDPAAAAAATPAPAPDAAVARRLLQSTFLIDEIIAAVIGSINNQHASAAEDALQLLVLQVLLTAVTSTECEVHERSLVRVIQACFAIHASGAKNSTNEVTAKASLTQMVNLIFSRMERYANVLAKTIESGASITKLPRVSSVIDVDRPSRPQTPMSPRTTAGARTSSLLSSSTAAMTLPEPDAPADAADAASEGSDAVQPLEADLDDDAPRARTSRDAPVRPHSLASTLEPVSVSALSTAGLTEGRSSMQSPLPPDDAVADADADADADASHPGTPSFDTTDNNPYNPSVSFYNDLLRKDVYLVFRLLCFLSMHTDAQSSQETSLLSAVPLMTAASAPHDELSPVSTKTRILAMELLLSVLNNIGPVLRTDALYIDLVKKSLCVSISRNAVNTNPVLFELSLSIFLLVIRHYREHLKLEVEVLLSTVYLQILEMGKWTRVSFCVRLVGGADMLVQTLVDLYVNYDCDLVMSSVFEKILNACSKITQGRSESTPKTASPSSFGIVGFAVGLDSKAELLREQDRRLKVRGLCTLVAAVQSLLEWSQEPASPAAPAASATAANGTTPARADSVALDASASGGADSDATPARPLSVASTVGAARSPGDFADQTKTFMDALAPTQTINPVVVVNRNPLHTVSMDRTGSGTSAGNGVPATETSPQDIEQVVTRKQQLRQIVRLFNQKPNKGVKLLVDSQFAPDEPEAIADFLRSTPELSKAAIGEYLGDVDPKNVRVLHAFVDAMDFSGLDFLAAFRLFLQLFRIPGEAQKIDRIVEKFADRYCESNPQVFANADTAYTLAFSVMMLNTDQHSKQIKVRMTKDDFLRNNRGINDNGDLPDEFLGAIFDEIQSNEIILEEEHADGKLAQIAMGWGAGELNDRQRMDLYRKEVSMIQKKSQMLMKAAGASNRTLTPFRVAVGRELARPMFALASWALMATFSLLFESAVDDKSDDIDFTSKLSTLGDPKVSDLCLRGFAGAIRLTCAFRMETERDAFVSSLSKLTSLSNFYNIKPKNVKAIRTLIDLAQSLGETLESSWLQIIKTISQIERMQMVVLRGSHADMGGARDMGRPSDSMRLSHDRSDAGMYAGSNGGQPSGSGGGAAGMAGGGLGGGGRLDGVGPGGSAGPRKISPALESLVSDFQSQTSLIVIDRIFTKTVGLSGAAIIHFFRAVCQVSLEEVGIDAGGQPITTATPGPPRMYLLQKIVEIAHYNMHRIRYEWTQIWRVLQPHFNTVACHPNQHVATFAVDSLRQLGMKFLEREELGHFSSQHEFLKSFEWIMKHNTSPVIRDLILSSLSQMITARARSIRSGWKSIFVVLVKAAQADERVAKTSFATVQMIFRGHFDDVVSTGGFVDLVSCLAEFALLKGQGPAHDELVMGSIQLLQSCTKSLVERAKEEMTSTAGGKTRSKRPSAAPASSVPPAAAGPAAAGAPHAPRINNLPQQPYLMSNGYVSEEHFYLSWFPILSAFSRVIIESDGVLVRTHTMETLFETFRSSGHLFEPAYWKTIHRNIITPIFEDLAEASDEPASREANSAVLILGLRLLVEMISLHFDLLVGPADTAQASAAGADAADDAQASMGSAGREFLQNSLGRMLAMMAKKDDKLAATGQICFQQFLVNNVHKLARFDSWAWLVDIIEGAFKATMPVELINCEIAPPKTPVAAAGEDEDGARASSTSVASSATPAPMTRLASKSRIVPMSEIMDVAKATARETGSPLSLEELDFEHTIIKCVTHLELLQTIRDFCLMDVSAARASGDQSAAAASPATPVGPASPPRLYAIGAMSAQDRARILKCVYSSYALARTFNGLMELRHAIWRRGWVTQLPNLVKQETVSFSTYLVLLFGAYKSIGDEGPAAMLADAAGSTRLGGDAGATLLIVDAIVKQTMDLLDRFIEFLGDAARNQREIALWSPIVILVFKELLTMDGWWLSGRSTGLPALGAGTPPSAAAAAAAQAVPVSTRPADPSRPTHVLRRHLPRYFRLAIRMMSVDRLEVRQVLQEFLERVGDEFVRVDE